MTRAVVLLGIAITAAPGSAQTAVPGKLGHASMTVSITTRSAATVHIRYVVHGSANAAMVPLAAVLFAPSMLDGVEAIIDGRASPVALTPGAGHAAARVSGGVPLPSGHGDTVAFELRYTVDLPGATAGEARVRLPVVAVLWPPAEALPGTFAIALDVPADTHIRGAFPSLMRETTTTATSRSYGAGMQVVPSMIAFDIGTGDPPRITLEAMLDTGVLALLLLFAILGWRHLRAQGQ